MINRIRLLLCVAKYIIPIIWKREDTCFRSAGEFFNGHDGKHGGLYSPPRALDRLRGYIALQAIITDYFTFCCKTDALGKPACESIMRQFIEHRKGDPA